MLLSLLTTPVMAVNKCVENNGRIFYQDAPCPANTHGGDMSENVNQTFSGKAERPAMTGVIQVLPDHPEPPGRNATGPDEQLLPLEK
ncbi:MAG: DUF4124 domain-containing protein [Candidatus Competibacteraceae bacterium]|nr:DUF4124 domain-containing protein [Candidatus Competibacteraceae bacterium]MCB1820795.1 DUF4124 domain-containing protein [Candidatus Competibacteraceae bacterium]